MPATAAGGFVRVGALLVLAISVVLFAAATATVESGSGDRSGAAGGDDEPYYGARDYASFVAEGHGDVLVAMRRRHQWRPFREVLADASTSVVRIRLHFNRDGGSYSTDHGSGFVLEGGCHVVTAAHVVDRLDDRDDCELMVALPDGRVLEAHPLVRNARSEIDEENDWAVLSLDEQVQGGLRVALPRGLPSVIALGFPEQIGLDRDGRVVADAIGEGFPLLPVALLGELDALADRRKVDLNVAFGSIPLGGMSGGPVIDEDGRVVGIETGVRRVRSSDGESRWYAVAHPVAHLRSWLKKNLPHAVDD